LVLTSDGFILSGHRRYAAAKLAGLRDVPCRVEAVSREREPDRFTKMLREFNRQREKSFDEKLREQLIDVDPEESHQNLVEHRKRKSRVDAPAITIRGEKRRARISRAKRPLLDAINRVLAERRKFWPLSDRAIHYALLNAPPLCHASKPDSCYANDKRSYKALVELLTRARLVGEVSMDAIHDPTRPVTTWQCWREPAPFIRLQLDEFLRGYARDLMQSQPNHLEIVGEKNTVGPILETVAGEYRIPLTIGRGFCSLPPRHAMANRYRESGKAKLVVLMLSDHDPDGEEIVESFARSMRDDFGVADIHPIKVALTAEQVRRFKLPPGLVAKTSSSNYGKFLKQHGRHAHELEALAPEQLQAILREAIDSVIDLKAFNREIDAEKANAAHLEGVRRTVIQDMKGMQFNDDRP
jgi:hypothetical protein